MRRVTKILWFKISVEVQITYGNEFFILLNVKGNNKNSNNLLEK